MQWKRGLWRLGLVLWGLTAIPTVFIAYHESIEPDYQWNERRIPSIGETLSREDFQKHMQLSSSLKEIRFAGVGIAHVPNYFTDEQTGKALLALERFTGLPLEKIAALSPRKSYVCSVQSKANLVKAALYSVLGLSLVFVLIQGGFAMALWVIGRFRNS